MLFSSYLKSEYLKYTIPPESHKYIIVSGFPKSGNTWVSNMVSQMLNYNYLGRFSCYANANYANILDLDIDRTRDGKAKILAAGDDERHVVKTHIGYSKYMRRVVCLIRNPIAVYKSYYNMWYNQGLTKLSPEKFLESPNYGLNNYIRFYTSYLQDSAMHSQILFMNYDWIKDNTESALNTISRVFINGSLDNKQIKGIVSNSSLQCSIQKESFVDQFDIRKKSNAKISTNYMFCGSQLTEKTWPSRLNKIIASSEAYKLYQHVVNILPK